jgi:cell division protein FtsI/penicillin-binding protein 2
MKLRTAILVYGVPITILAFSLRHGRPPAAMRRVSALAPPIAASEDSRASFSMSLTRELHPRGDAWLRGELDLAKLRLDAAQDRYEAPLSGGRTAILTLDPRLMARAQEVIDDAKAPYAAIVVMSTDGRLLALAAKSDAEPGKTVDELALRPWAPAASVFKIVTASALVAAGTGPDTEVCYHAGMHALDETNVVDQSYDATCNSLDFGVAASQNAIVGKLAVKKLTAAKLRDAASLFGFGAAPDFALAAAPSKLELADDASPLELARAAAGFAHSRLSAIDGARIAATIATGGMSITPTIVAGVLEPSGVTPIRATSPTRALDDKVATQVGKMMIGVTERGTAYKAFHDGHGRRILGDAVIAGKTGSLDEDSLGYSWFVGYGPVAKPRYVISVVLGNSAAWRMKANVAARRVLEAAFQK